MIFLWTRNNLVGSKLIRWGLDEPTSHFAVCFFEDRGVSAPVIESRVGSGVGLDFLGDFRARNEIVHAIQAPTLSGRGEGNLFHKTSARIQGKSYDNWGILYWAYASLNRKLFGTSLPTKNRWGRNEVVYCVEVMEAMPEYLSELGILLDTFDLEMTTPEMMYTILNENQHLIDVTESFKSVSFKA